MTKERRRTLIAALAAIAVLAPIALLWQASRVPATYSVMDMGYLDFGGGPSVGAVHGAHGAAQPTSGRGMPNLHAQAADAGGGRSVADLRTDPDRKADVRVDLVARKGTITLASGRKVEGYTLNGQSPGPTIEVTQGQLLEVRLTNESVPTGVTLHWHGIDVPNAEDGVAGVTQDAVAKGKEHTYRFIAEDTGTYWYHSHQVSHEQVVGGLFGPLVVHPKTRDAAVLDVLAVAHLYKSRQTLNGREGVVAVPAKPGQRARVRVVNTDNGPLEAWSSAAYRLVSLDGRDLHGPTPVTGKALTVTAGGRADLELEVPASGEPVRVQVGSATALVLGAEGASAAKPAQPKERLDLLAYGTPAPVGFDPTKPARRFDYSIGRRPGFLDGKPGFWWSVNGHLFPDLPMYVVKEGDVVMVRLENHSGDVHPMHLHGHHAIVVKRDGKPVTGSPWWFDSLNVRDGETFDIAFVADNPGVWMDHCHNLEHAADGMVTHLMYEDVTEPFRVGGPPGNEPE